MAESLLMKIHFTVNKQGRREGNSKRSEHTPLQHGTLPVLVCHNQTGIPSLIIKGIVRHGLSP